MTAADPAYMAFEPSLSADGNRVLFLSTRPTAGEEAKPGWANQNIFAADRRADGTWGEPYDLGAPINTTDAEFYPSLTRDGSLYFTRGQPHGPFVIVRSRWTDGRFQPPDTLPAAVNGRGMPYNAFIAPDESYLIACVDGRQDGAEPGRPQYFAFFRDPVRPGPRGEQLVIAPADGRVVSIIPIEEPDLLKGPATRISIFMNQLRPRVPRRQRLRGAGHQLPR